MVDIGLKTMDIVGHGKSSPELTAAKQTGLQTPAANDCNSILSMTHFGIVVRD